MITHSSSFDSDIFWITRRLLGVTVKINSKRDELFLTRSISRYRSRRSRTKNRMSTTFKRVCPSTRTSRKNTRHGWSTCHSLYQRTWTIPRCWSSSKANWGEDSVIHAVSIPMWCCTCTVAFPFTWSLVSSSTVETCSIGFSRMQLNSYFIDAFFVLFDLKNAMSYFQCECRTDIGRISSPDCDLIFFKKFCRTQIRIIVLIHDVRDSGLHAQPQIQRLESGWVLVVKSSKVHDTLEIVVIPSASTPIFPFASYQSSSVIDFCIIDGYLVKHDDLFPRSDEIWD